MNEDTVEDDEYGNEEEIEAMVSKPPSPSFASAGHQTDIIFDNNANGVATKKPYKTTGLKVAKIRSSRSRGGGGGKRTRTPPPPPSKLASPLNFIDEDVSLGSAMLKSPPSVSPSVVSSSSSSSSSYFHNSYSSSSSSYSQNQQQMKPGAIATSGRALSGKPPTKKASPSASVGAVSVAGPGKMSPSSATSGDDQSNSGGGGGGGAQEQLSRMEEEVRAKTRAAPPSIVGAQSIEPPKPDGGASAVVNLSRMEEELRAKSRAAPPKSARGGGGGGGGGEPHPPSSSRPSVESNLNQMEEDLRAKTRGSKSKIGGVTKVGAQSVGPPAPSSGAAASSVEPRLNQREEDMRAKKRAAPPSGKKQAGGMIKIGAQSVGPPAPTDGGASSSSIEASLSRIEEDLMTKARAAGPSRGANAGGSGGVASSSIESNLNQMEEDMRAKSRSAPSGKVGVTKAGAQSVRSSTEAGLTQIEEDTRAKSRAGPARASSTAATHHQPKVGAQSVKPSTPPRSGIASSLESSLNRMEEDMIAKTRAAPLGASAQEDVRPKKSATGSSVVGAQSVRPSTTPVASTDHTEEDMRAKARAAHTGGYDGASKVGARSVGPSTSSSPDPADAKIRAESSDHISSPRVGPAPTASSAGAAMSVSAGTISRRGSNLSTSSGSVPIPVASFDLKSAVHDARPVVPVTGGSSVVSAGVVSLDNSESSSYRNLIPSAASSVAASNASGGVARNVSANVSVSSTGESSYKPHRNEMPNAKIGDDHSRASNNAYTPPRAHNNAYFDDNGSSYGASVARGANVTNDNVYGARGVAYDGDNGSAYGADNSFGSDAYASAAAAGGGIAHAGDNTAYSSAAAVGGGTGVATPRGEYSSPVEVVPPAGIPRPSNSPVPPASLSVVPTDPPYHNNRDSMEPVPRGTELSPVSLSHQDENLMAAASASVSAHSTSNHNEINYNESASLGQYNDSPINLNNEGAPNPNGVTTEYDMGSHEASSSTAASASVSVSASINENIPTPIPPPPVDGGYDSVDPVPGEYGSAPLPIPSLYGERPEEYPAMDVGQVEVPIDESGGIQAFVAETVVDATGVAVVRSEAEEEKIERKRYMRIFSVVCSLLVLSVITVTISVTLMTRKGKAGEVKDITVIPTAAPSSAPSFSPTSHPSSSYRLNALEHIVQKKISTQESLQTIGSPQRLAFDWITEADPAGPHVVGSLTFVQRYIAAVLYFGTGGDDWLYCSRELKTCSTKTVEPFLSGYSVCVWFGMRCTPLRQDDKNVDEEREIDRIFFGTTAGNNLVGTIPEEVCHLSQLKEFITINNFVEGPIPQCFGKLSLLSTFRVENNKLVSPLPKDFVKLKHLVDISLAENEFTGPLPAFPESSLFNFDVAFNKFSGTISSSFGAMSNMKSFHTNNNELTGTIPTEFSQLNKMEKFLIFNNTLSGQMPNGMYNLPQMSEFKIANNSFTGSLPTYVGDFGKGSTKRKFLWLENNKFEGKIPEGFEDIENLYELRLNGNQLSGSITDRVCKKRGNLFKDLYVLTVNCSQVQCSCCSDPCPLPPTMAPSVLEIGNESSSNGTASTITNNNITGGTRKNLFSP